MGMTITQANAALTLLHHASGERPATPEALDQAVTALHDGAVKVLGAGQMTQEHRAAAAHRLRQAGEGS